MYEPQHLKRWTMPDHYFGAVWPAYYSAGVGQSRDSDTLERSNFACMLQALGGEDSDETIIVARESHWAVGWIEWIAIHQDNETALQIADKIKGELADYPAINDDHWSELEWTEAADYWESLPPREKVRMAMDERRRYHWLQATPVWTFGRMSFHALANHESPIANAIYESLRV